MFSSDEENEEEANVLICTWLTHPSYSHHTPPSYLLPGQQQQQFPQPIIRNQQQINGRSVEREHKV